jgi:uncharacterized protein YrzB (UPF0473 family)
MSEEFGSDFITITDDDGNQYELEHLDTLEIDGVFYLAFLPADVDEDDERYGIIIMKQETENGESYLVVPGDEELDFAYQRFMERLFDDEDEAE